MSVHENSTGKKPNGAGGQASNTFYIAFTSCIAVTRPLRGLPRSLVTFCEQHFTPEHQCLKRARTIKNLRIQKHWA